MVLTPEQWQRAEDLFERCLELPEEDCHALLLKDCVDDPALQETVWALLKSAQAAGSFLQTPFVILDQETEQSPDLLGRVLSGRFLVLNLIGSGGMGEVYRARDERLGRVVALKVLRPELVHDPEWRLRFEREARAISSLSHSNICALYDVRDDGDLIYLVME